MPLLVTVTGPIAAGKNTVADTLAPLLVAEGLTVVVTDVDDVAGMVTGGAPGELWPCAHRAHGLLVGSWLRSPIDVLIAVGPFHSEMERAALEEPLPAQQEVLRVVIDADLAVTWPRALGDPTRGLSRQREFHESAHHRYRQIEPSIPRDLTFDAGAIGPHEIAAEIRQAITASGSVRR